MKDEGQWIDYSVIASCSFKLENVERAKKFKFEIFSSLSPLWVSEIRAKHNINTVH